MRHLLRRLFHRPEYLTTLQVIRRLRCAP